jgi:hypothetical protein
MPCSGSERRSSSQWRRTSSLPRAVGASMPPPVPRRTPRVSRHRQAPIGQTTSSAPKNPLQPWTPAPHRTPALPTPAPHRTPALPKDTPAQYRRCWVGTMWRAVPGGAVRNTGTVPGRCGGRCQGVLGLRPTRLASGKEAMPGLSGCQPPRPSVPADASDPGWPRSPLCSSRGIPSTVMKEPLARRREPFLSGTKAYSSRS